jgi:hypothetical protein
MEANIVIPQILPMLTWRALPPIDTGLRSGGHLIKETMKKEEVDAGGLAELPIEIPAIERKRIRSRRRDSTKGIEAKKDESIDVP